MKKFSMFILGLASILVVTGCGSKETEKTLVCTMSQDESGMSMEQTISMVFKKDKVNHMKMDVNTKATDEKLKENWDIFTKTLDEENQETEQDGVLLKVSKDDKNYEYRVTLDIDIEKASKEVLEKYDLDDLTGDNGTLEENKKSAESNGFTCKVEE